MPHFCGKILGSNYVKKKICLHKFLPKLSPIWEKRVLIFKLSSFCPVNLNQHCISRQIQSESRKMEDGEMELLWQKKKLKKK